MNTQRPTPRTDAHILESLHEKEMGDYLARLNRIIPFTRDLECELAEAQTKLSTVHQWIERNHPDGFIDSQTHLQNLERVTENWHDRLDTVERSLRKARDERDVAQIPICIGKPLIQILAKEGQWTSENGNGLVAADCLFRNDPYAENEAMRAAIQAAATAFQFITSNWTERDLKPSETIRQVFHAEKITEAKFALAALKPFLSETPTK